MPTRVRPELGWTSAAHSKIIKAVIEGILVQAEVKRLATTPSG